MDNVIVLDLETIPDESKIHLLPAPNIRKNLTDPRKIEKELKEKKAKQLEEMGLDPNFANICCVSFRDKNEASTILSKNEPDLLMEIWNTLADYKQFVTFNGHPFDIPFLIKRSWLLGIKPTVKIDNKKYYSGNHLDLRAILNNWDKYESGTLDFYCQLKLGKGKAGGMDGSMVYPLWKEKKFDEIKGYSADEIELLWELFLSMKGYYF